MRASTSIGILAVLITGPLHVSAQARAHPGDRVRVQSRDGVVVVGTISSISSESITVHRGAGHSDLTLPAAEVSRVERNLGSQRRFGRNFALTVVASSAAGGLVSALTWSPCRETGFLACLLHPDSRGEAFSWGVVGGAIIGAPLGVIIGLAMKTERWERIPLPDAPRGRVSLAPVIGSQLGLVGSISLGGLRRTTAR